jgi:phage portal protein BeeE
LPEQQGDEGRNPQGKIRLEKPHPQKVDSDKQYDRDKKTVKGIGFDG